MSCIYSQGDEELDWIIECLEHHQTYAQLVCYQVAGRFAVCGLVMEGQIPDTQKGERAWHQILG